MKVFKKLLSSLVVMLVVITSITTIETKALSDGAYLVLISVDYRNPETGLIEDGGSEQNYQLGLSMCQNIVSPNALLEISNGKKYITLRFSMISNVSDISINVQGTSGGSYYNTATTVMQTGNDTADYRFEVTGEELYISPSMYITPMGRNVKFFIRLNTSQALSGNGDFIKSIEDPVSEVVINNEQEIQSEVVEENINNSEVVEEVVEEEIEEEKTLVSLESINLDQVEGITEFIVNSESDNGEESENNTSKAPYIITAIVVVILLALGVTGFVLRKKLIRR